LRRSQRPLVIAARPSRLARAQAEMVGRALEKLNTGLTVDYRWIESEGDQMEGRPLADRGGKSLFTRAVSRELLAGKADIAVHSLKDLGAEQPAGLTLAAIPRRGEVRDCLISPHPGSIADLPAGATVGTASPRRAAQLKHLRPDLALQLLRGNIETRIRRVLEERRHDATLLAAAGLHRAGLLEHTTRPVPVETILPAPAQGALAIECRIDDHTTLTRCLPLNHTESAEAVHGERRLIAGLGGNCHSPIAALITPAEGEDGAVGYRVRIKALHPKGERVIEHDAWAAAGELTDEIDRILKSLDAQGARALIREGTGKRDREKAGGTPNAER